MNYLGTKIRVRFSGSCLKQDKIAYTHGKILSIYIVYEINKKDSTTSSDPTLENCLFGAVTLTKNVNIDKYRYSGYGIRFDGRASYSFPGGGLGQNVLIFGVDMSFSTHIDNFLVLSSWKKTITRIRTYFNCTAEKIYSINFTEKSKNFCLSLHCNGVNSYLLVNGAEIYKLKAKDSEIVASPLCLGNTSSHWLIDNMKRTRFNGYVCDFSVDYNATDVDEIKDIHKHLIKKIT